MADDGEGRDLPSPLVGEGGPASAGSDEGCGAPAPRDRHAVAPLTRPLATRAGPSLSHKGRGVLATLLLCALALFRPVDHDESQYVAAAVLSAHGLIPYRDYAYLQTPLQPLLLASLAWASGPFAWPALRIANALFAAAAVALTYRAARTIAGPRAGLTAAALFAGTDILLFAAGTARNDAAPAACLAGALWLGLRAQTGARGRWEAVATGLLLAAAAAAKLSYAVPALAYGGWALWHHRRCRPLLVAAGALPMLALVGWTWAQAPAGFVFGVWTFPTAAPLDFYADRPWKLSFAAKLVDAAKFLALGAALPALAVVVRRRPPGLLVLFLAAGAVAALLPTPTWRQYLLPLLPPVFVALAWVWSQRPPGRVQRVVFVAFAIAGLAPSVAALVADRPGMITAMRHGAAIRRTMDAAGVSQVASVTTLSPQYLPATGRPVDPSFAPGPFVFRSRRLVPFARQYDLRVLSRDVFVGMPNAQAVLVGGEDRWSGGDPALDRVLEQWARAKGYPRHDVPGTPFRLYVGPPILPTF